MIEHGILTVIIAVVVVMVLYFQWKARREVKHLNEALKKMMPRRLAYGKADASSTCEELGGNREMMQQIDKYLEANKTMAPNFDIIKDIVERSTSEVDEQIRVLLPMPLYYGLCGTIAGIILGLIPLIEDQTNLMESISSLLMGVSIAMTGSLVGVLLTAHASHEHRETVRELEAGKRAFFNWFQVAKLPVLGNDPSGPIGQLIRSLSKFNQEFSESAGVMATTADSIADTFSTQLELLEEMKNLNASKIAKRNLEMAQQMEQHVDVVRSFNNSITGMQSYVEKLQSITSTLSSSTDYLQVVGELVSLLNSEQSAIRQAAEGMSGQVSTMYSNQQRLLNDALGKIQEQNEVVVKQFIGHQNATAQALTEHLNKYPTIPSVIQDLAKLPDAIERLGTELERMTSVSQSVDKRLGGVETHLQGLEKRSYELERQITQSVAREQEAKRSKGHPNQQKHKNNNPPREPLSTGAEVAPQEANLATGEPREEQPTSVGVAPQEGNIATEESVVEQLPASEAEPQEAQEVEEESPRGLWGFIRGLFSSRTKEGDNSKS